MEKSVKILKTSKTLEKKFSVLVPDMLVRSDKDLCFYSTCQIGETSDSFHIDIL